MLKYKPKILTTIYLKIKYIEQIYIQFYIYFGYIKQYRMMSQKNIEHIYILVKIMVKKGG